MRDLKVWVRVGDLDDYHDFDSVDESAEYVAEMVAVSGTPVVRRARHSGIIGVDLDGTCYVGENAVSLYWGDDDADYECELTDFELEVFGRILGVALV